jgi:hypothetical protein
LFRKLPVNFLSVGNQTTIFSEQFKGFEKSKAVVGIFGEKTSEVLSNLKVELSWVGGYMYVDGSDGHMVISKNYLNTGRKRDIYLDLIHELYHVKQFMEGKELFDSRYGYVDRPTEVEAYRYTVKEALRIGLSAEEVFLYLKTEWMSAGDVKRLLRNIGFESLIQLSSNSKGSTIPCKP